jgi:uncharacterized protein (DUF2141 family)
MIRHFAAFLLAGTVHGCFAQNDLKISIVLNKPQAGGMLRVALCSSKEIFDSEKGCKLLSAPADANMVTVTYTDLPAGEYAVKVFHDINSDSELNTSWLGWPKEPYGFSNDAPVNMGPPPFRFAAFHVTNGANSIRIALR